jgi:glucose/arabinose dehydrogenase
MASNITRKKRSAARWAVVFALLAAACQAAAPPLTAVESQPVAGGPVLLRDGIALRKVAEVGGGNIRLARNPVSGAVYYLNPASGVFRVELDTGATTRAVPLKDITADGVPSGLAFGPDGAMYVVLNRSASKTETQAVVRRGAADSAGAFTWTTFASTEPYPLSNTFFDHLFNGIIVSPDGQWVYLNSGSRTDHGEVQSNGGAFPETREVALTSKIFRLPASASALILPDDLAALQSQNLIFAYGTRNAYDPAFAPNGELFVGDNGPDADYADELNWVREGRHYGFPWRFGAEDNPQQFPDYTSIGDKRLNADFAAVQGGFYRTDPAFPPAPTDFTDPVINLGPDAAQYRAEDGSQRDAAAEGKALSTFTPHRSPLGLAFAETASLPADLRGGAQTLSAFVLSWGAAGGTLTDKGQDLLHLRLTRRADNYEAVTHQIARNFKNPIDSVLIENRLYVLEFGLDGAIWELTFE